MTAVLFGISGSVAAFRGLEIIRLLIADGIDVYPVISKGGAEFVTRVSLEALSGKPVLTDIFDQSSQNDIQHIEFVKNCDLMITCPASADIIAKYAVGIADDPLALIALTFGTPHLIAPAMNWRMWENPATLANVETLKLRGFEFIGPDKGMMACNEEGWGRLAPVDVIYASIKIALGKNGPLSGKRVLITAGATREFLDDVRYFTNRSSGKMGFALASEARNLGADVTLISGNSEIPLDTSTGIDVQVVTSASEMFERTTTLMNDADIIIMSAAVADYSPSTKIAGKLKKTEDSISVELNRTSDILKRLGELKSEKQVLVGFAAEYGSDGISEALRKCTEKNCDFVCMNDVSRNDIGFESDENEMSIVFRSGDTIGLDKAPKKKIASQILHEAVTLLKTK